MLGVSLLTGGGGASREVPASWIVILSDFNVVFLDDVVRCRIICPSR